MIPSKTVLGIVAEYDPFHNGHAYHLEQARKSVRPDSVYTVISPCLKQRGELSLLSPYMRGACAVQAGADAVFTLPVLWTVRDAEHYALGAVSLLCGLGITHLSFGAETDDLKILSLAADFLEDPPSGFPETLKLFLQEGTGYPAALSKAVSFYLPEAGPALSSPNNILGICYLRALRKLDSGVVPVVLPRRGSYHEASVDAGSPSASALRNALGRGDFFSAYRAVPPYSADKIRRAFLSGKIPDPVVWDTLRLNKLRTADLTHLPDLSEGLEDALKKSASESRSIRDVTELMTSRRYPSARIVRMIAHAVLDVTEDRIRRLPLPSDTLLLAIRKEKALTDRWKDLPVHIAPSAVEWRHSADPEDLMAWRLWAMCCHLPDTLPFSEKIYTE